ncbi:MAG: ABC transporter substrate-binding protein [Pseudodesulfovibrio sp.]
MRYKKIVASLVLACACLLGASPATAGQTPMDRVKEGADKLIKLLSDPAVTDPVKHDAAIQELRATAEQYIDFRLVTMYAVGKPWLDMAPQLQNDLVESFVQLLQRTYLKRIPAYEGQAVNYVKQEVQGNKARVLTEIDDKDKKIIVEFRLRLVQDTWMIYDVVAEGVSLVANYRSQFSQILADGDGQKLLELIKNRVKQLDEGKSDDNATLGQQG